MDTQIEQPDKNLPFLSFAADPPPSAVVVSVDTIVAGETGFLCFGKPGSGKSHELRSQME